VDTYHYTNHKATDDLCPTWYNPTLSPEVDPNLVGTQIDKDSILQLYWKFNTKAAKQLNSWLAEYAPVLKCMNAANFNWFLHTMLFVHTQHNIKKRTPENNLVEEEHGIESGSEESQDTEDEEDEEENRDEEENENEENEENEEDEENDTEKSSDNEQSNSSDKNNSSSNSSSTDSSRSSGSSSSDSQ